MKSNIYNKEFEEFYNSARFNKTLDSKSTLLIHIASAMALGCYPWMDSYFGEAKEAGITTEEIQVVQSIVMAVSAGKIRAQFREVRRKHNKN